MADSASGPGSHSSSLALDLLRDLRRTWPQLLVTDLLAKAAGFVVLIPAGALLLWLFVAGDGVLTDEEILLFFVSPAGLIMLVLAGAIGVGLTFAEQAALLVVGFGAVADRRVTYLEALGHAAFSAPSLVRLAGRVVARALLISTPFLTAGAAVYAWLLTDYDINYYLALKPPIFWKAGALIGAILLLLAVTLARFLLGWMLALPILLNERVSPGRALQLSAQSAAGNRSKIGAWLAAWGLTVVFVSTLMTGIVGFASRMVVPTHTESLTWVALMLGIALCIQTAAQLALSAVGSALLGLLIVQLYVRYRGEPPTAALPVAATQALGSSAHWSIPRRGILWGSLAVAVGVIVVAAMAAYSVPVQDDATVIAHRGASAAAPENTLASVQRAIDERTDWVEIDVQESADGVVVVAHDQDFMKVSGVNDKVWNTTYDDLLELDIGGWFGEEFRNQRVPTLEQVLTACKGKARVIIELKYYGHADRLEERVVQIVEAAGMASDVAIMSLSYPGVLKIKQLRPAWRYGVLAAVTFGDLTAMDVDFLAVNTSVANRALISAAARRGQQVYVWTVNDPVQMSALLSLGIDGLITDEPALLRDVLEQREEMSPVERLLIGIGAQLGVLDSSEPASDPSGA